MSFNFLIVIPPVNIEEQYGNLARAGTELPVLGLSYVAKFARKSGVTVEILDMPINNMSFNNLRDKIRSFKPSMIGFPVYVTTTNSVKELCRSIKDEFPDIKTVVGGPQVTLFPEDFFEDYIDFGICGEGEYTIAQLIQSFDSPEEYHKINGLFYKTNKTKEGHSYNEARSLETDLDNFGPPDLSFFQMDKYYPSVQIIGKKVFHTLTTRGCPYRCTFCAASKICGRKVRKRSIPDVINELEYMIGLGYDSIVFYDDTFTLYRKRVIEISKSIKQISRKFKKKINWACFTRTDCVDPEMLEYMRGSGCYLITFGCESGNDKTLIALKKGLTVEQNYSGIEYVYNSGILAASSFMIGLPGETVEDIDNTIDFACNSKLSLAYFPIFEPYKGTPIWSQALACGSFIESSNYENKSKIWVPNGLERNIVEQKAKEAFQKFYLRPKIVKDITFRLLLKLPIRRLARFLYSSTYYFTMANFEKRNVGSRY